MPREELKKEITEFMHNFYGDRLIKVCPSPQTHHCSHHEQTTFHHPQTYEPTYHK